MLQNQMPASFYEQDAISLATQLLGKFLVHENVVIRIVETEAYMPQDTASHAYKGQTKRNIPMFMIGGTIYVYICYGMHQMLNIVSGKKGSPQAVLIRGGEVIEGKQIVLSRRNNLDLNGPGKLAQGLGINTSFSGSHIGQRISIWDAPLVSSYQSLPRVGIDYAEPKDRDALWRFMTPPQTSPKKLGERKRKEKK